MSLQLEQGTLRACLVRALVDAARYDKQDQTPPAAVLWTDGGREWEDLVPALRADLPLFTLGLYDRETRTGPAYWLRCVVEGQLLDPPLEQGQAPILYLPGSSRQDLRSIDSCGPDLQPLVELQYRGSLWAQKNGRDWTISAFLQNAEIGLGIEVASDNATKEALILALPKLAQEPLQDLRREAPIRAPYLHGLLNPDEVKKILQWLDAPDEVRQAMSPEEWEAFVAISRSRYAFDPEKDSVITAAGLLGQRNGSWRKVWERFAEAPGSYAAIPNVLRQARPASLTPLFDAPEAWPQDNEKAEGELRQALLELAHLDQESARVKVLELERQHGYRRRWVWNQLGQAPLARAVEHLAAAALATHQPISGDTTTAVTEAYAERGWKADLAVVEALAEVESASDLAALRAALQTFYRPWLEVGALALQRAVALGSGAGGYAASAPPTAELGTCILFSDGLRFDVAHRLQALLESDGLQCDLLVGLAALPTVTGTAKPSIAPAAAAFGPASHGFDPVLTATGTTVSVSVLRRALHELGYQILQGQELGEPEGRGWTELGNLDAYGHAQGLTMARRVAEELRMIQQRIADLLEHGWQQVTVVTDHGWLLVPGGLPKAELPKHLTDGDKGRCARLKEGAVTDHQTVAWRWDPSVRIAIAPGIHCYEANKEYEHGGLSPQECVVAVLTVHRPAAAQEQPAIESVTWRGLRCTVVAPGAKAPLKADLRTRAGDATTSLVRGGKVLDDDGTVSLLVEDDAQEGSAAAAIIVGPDGTLRAQVGTVVGG